MPEQSALSHNHRRIHSPVRAGSARRGSLRVASSIALAIMCMFSVVLSACGSATNDAGNLAKDQVFTWPYDKPRTTMITGAVHGEVFDPATVSSVYDSGTLSMIYTGLVTFDSGLNVVSDAALTWDIEGNGTIYTFHLRHNLHFSDGKPLTANDFAYSINRALDPALCSVQDVATYGLQGTKVCSAVPQQNPPIAAGYLGAILGADKRLAGPGGDSDSLISQGDDPNHGLNVIDPYTLRIRLSKPAAYFLEALTYPTSFPVERSLVEKYHGGLWVDHLNEGGCSGPFQIKSYGDGKKLTLVPNPQWEQAFGKNLTLTEVDRPLMQSFDTEYADYRTGLYDYTTVPGNQYTFARGQDDFNEVPTLSTRYYGLNFTKAPFDDERIRRAFDLALNKQLLVDRIWNGGAIPSNHIIPRGMPGYFDGLKNPKPDETQSLTGNQEAAVNLIKDAAKSCTPGNALVPDYCDYITDKQAEIDVWVGTSDQTSRDMVAAAAQQWSSVLKLNVKAHVAASFDEFIGLLQKPSTAPQVWYLGWVADYPDPQDWLSLQFHSNLASNASGVNDSGLDALMEKADKEQDLKARMNDYNQAEQNVVDMCAWIPVLQGKLFWRQRRWVHGFGLNPLNNMVDINWPNVYITEH